MGAWVFVPTRDGAGQGLAGRGWQEPVPSPSPVPPWQAEAAEHGGGGGPAAPEGAVHLCKCGSGHRARIGAGAAAWHRPQGMAFPSRAPRAPQGRGGVTPSLFPGGPARRGRQAAAQEIGVRGGGESVGGRARCRSLLPRQRCPQLDGDPAGGCMGGWSHSPMPPGRWVSASPMPTGGCCHHRSAARQPPGLLQAAGAGGIGQQRRRLAGQPQDR